VAGDTIGADFQGFLRTGSVTTVAKGAGTRVAALVIAVAEIQDGGFYGLLAVAASPSPVLRPGTQHRASTQFRKVGGG
jgi:hypothetical protein